MKVNIHEDYLRSVLFGFQDGLVSTTGVVTGIAAGVEDQAIIILAAFVAVTVEATSMAAGQYSSEKAVHQMDKTGSHTDSLLMGALLMFMSYLMAGLVPILPYLISPRPYSIYISIVLAFIGLFLLGFVKGHVVGEKPLRSAIEMFVIGAIATGIGLTVGYFLKV